MNEVFAEVGVVPIEARPVWLITGVRKVVVPVQDDTRVEVHQVVVDEDKELYMHVEEHL